MDDKLDIDVSGMFDRLKSISRAGNEYKDAIKTMKNTLELLEPLCPIIDKINKGYNV